MSQGNWRHLRLWHLVWHLFASNNANYADNTNNADLSLFHITTLFFSKLLAIMSLAE